MFYFFMSILIVHMYFLDHLDPSDSLGAIHKQRRQLGEGSKFGQFTKISSDNLKVLILNVFS